MRSAEVAPQRRLQSIDILRGAVMVLMAVDHIRDFLHAGSQRFSPEDLTQTNVVLFFTRWVTHFCAPVFIFLAGTSAYLVGRRRASRAEVSRLLLTRGLWLIVIEITVVLFATSFNLSYALIILQVIWAIGWSMVALSALMFLPWPVLLAFSLAVIGLHDRWDAVRPEQFGSLGWLWSVLHVAFAPLEIAPGHTALVIYPLIPWVAVMSAGYCCGRVFDRDPESRRRVLIRLGVGAIAAFVVLRAMNVYGDPVPWASQRTPIMTALSFIRATKYPASLDYVLMTLGPALVMLGLLDRVQVSLRNPLLVFGRVPFFYYIVHWYILHLVALAMAWVRYGRVDFLFDFPPSLSPSATTAYPSGYGYPLWVIYVVWCGIVVSLYPLCLWFARLKERRRSVWLSYL